jgi:hypothetical protein
MKKIHTSVFLVLQITFLSVLHAEDVAVLIEKELPEISWKYNSKFYRDYASDPTYSSQIKSIKERELIELWSKSSSYSALLFSLGYIQPIQYKEINGRYAEVSKGSPILDSRMELKDYYETQYTLTRNSERTHKLYLNIYVFYKSGWSERGGRSCVIVANRNDGILDWRWRGSLGSYVSSSFSEDSGVLRLMYDHRLENVFYDEYKITSHISLQAKEQIAQPGGGINSEAAPRSDTP